MSQEYKHPIGPPPELVQEWIDTDEGGPGVIKRIAARAAQWGADTELVACVEWFSKQKEIWTSDQLRAARRYKPPSLKQQALAALSDMSIEPCVINGVDTNASVRAKYDTIRRALEQLDD